MFNFPLRFKQYVMLHFVICFFLIIFYKVTDRHIRKSHSLISEYHSSNSLTYKKVLERCQVEKIDKAKPWIFVITATYRRPEQKAELTRLCHTFLLVQNLLWIIVEDANSKTNLIKNFLERCGVKYVHLNKQTPSEWKHKDKDPHWKKPRGVLQRNEGLQWLRNHYSRINANGVIYFADDDNVYDLQIFEEMRHTKKVSVWPVGLVGGLLVETPILDKLGKVVNFTSVWRPERPFPIGFAINLGLFLQYPSAKFSLNVSRGYQETEILRHLVSRTELEPQADNCTMVYVWHTRTQPTKLLQKNVNFSIFEV